MCSHSLLEIIIIYLFIYNFLKIKKNIDVNFLLQKKKILYFELLLSLNNNWLYMTYETNKLIKH